MRQKHDGGSSASDGVLRNMSPDAANRSAAAMRTAQPIAHCRNQGEGLPKKRIQRGIRDDYVQQIRCSVLLLVEPSSVPFAQTLHHALERTTTLRQTIGKVAAAVFVERVAELHVRRLVVRCAQDR
jgi:hypothetical protein